MRELQKFMKSTGIYLIGNILTKAVSFFMLPLYTKFISPEDYGTYDLHIAYITFLSSILFLDIWGGIMRFMFDYEKEEEKAKPVANGMLIFLGSTLVYTIFVAGMGTLLEIPYTGLLYLYGIVTNLSQVAGYVARALGKNHVYVMGGLVGTIVTILCNIIFIAGLKYGYEYLYVSYNLGMMVNIGIVAGSLHIHRLLGRKFLDKKLFLEMLGFAAPLSLNSTAYWFLTSYNKLVIEQKLSTVENGLYAVASKFTAMIQLVTQCFQMAWQELTFSKAGTSKEEMEVFYTKAVNEYIKFMGCGTILLLPVIKIIFPFMVDPSYSEAEQIIPFALLGTLFSCIGSFLASILSTIKKNQMIFTTTAQGSIVNVAVIHLLIGRLGVQAATVSFAAGYLAVVIRRILLLNQYFTIRIHKLRVLCLAGGFAAAYIVYITQNRWINFLLLCVLCIVMVYSYRALIQKMLRVGIF